MIIKLLLLAGLAAATSKCKFCYQEGTIRCDELTLTCVCHVGFEGNGCQTQECSDDHCSGHGKCRYHLNGYECVCDAGYWGRTCAYADHETHNVMEIEKKLSLEKCGRTENCKPPSNRINCTTVGVGRCNAEGFIDTLEKCPYPLYCYKAFRNGKCDWECERSECLYDGFDCTIHTGCPIRCYTPSGQCDYDCYRDMFRQERIPRSEKPLDALLEITMQVPEETFSYYSDEILRNISEPLGTPLEYHREHNQAFDTKIRRKRRMNEEYTVMNVEVAKKLCYDAAGCVGDEGTASQVLAIAAVKKSNGYLSKIKQIRLVPKPQDHSNLIGACILIVAVPLVLIGYRVVSAPVWWPPRSENEDGQVSSLKVSPYKPPSGKPTPLHEDCYFNNRLNLPICPEYVNALDGEGRTPLFWLIASEKGAQSVLEDLDNLVRAGANLNHFDHKGATPLSIAITAIRPSICTRLVQLGADPAAVTTTGASCLHLAVAQDDQKCVEWLLSFDAVRNNINEVDESDRTPLAMAAQGGMASAQIAEVLIRAGADVLHQGNQSTMWRYRGRTALHWAAQFNNIDVMKVLIDHRSDVNCGDVEHCTPLHFAVQRGSEAAVRMLLENQANTDIVNDFNEKPMDIARKNGSQPLMEMIAWYSDVRKEGLMMKKRAKKREKRPSDSSSYSSKRVRSDDTSPFSDTMSMYSFSSGYSSSGQSSETTSIGSGTSMASSCSTPSYSSNSSYSTYASSSTLPPPPPSPKWLATRRGVKVPALPPINEKPQLSFDFVRSETYIPPGVSSHSTRPCKCTASSSSSSSTPAGDFDSILLSPYSERCPSERSMPESPRVEGGANWDGEKTNDGYDNEELQEFFVNLNY